MESYGSPYQVGLAPTPYQLKFQTESEQFSTDDLNQLHVAVFHNKPDLIDIFIEDYSNEIDSQDDQGNTSLMFAAFTGNEKSINKLLTYGPQLSLMNKNGQTALFIALRYNHPDAARLLLKAYGETPEGVFEALSLVDKSGYTVLHYAAFCNDDDLLDELSSLYMIDMMIEDTTNSTCSTPLHYAASNGNYKVVRWLLEHGASPNTENCMGQIPLLLAVKNNHIE